jgi:hypothetical protein
MATTLNHFEFDYQEVSLHETYAKVICKTSRMADKQKRLLQVLTDKRSKMFVERRMLQVHSLESINVSAH